MSIEFIGMACALGLSAMGSAFGSGFAAQASVGAWKKCYANGKPAPFIMVAFSGAPLTQTIYGFLLMNFIRSAVEGGCDAALAMFPASSRAWPSVCPPSSRARWPPPLPTRWARPERVPPTTSSSSVLSKRWPCSRWCSAFCCCNKRVLIRRIYGRKSHRKPYGFRWLSFAQKSFRCLSAVCLLYFSQQRFVQTTCFPWG